MPVTRSIRAFPGRSFGQPIASRRADLIVPELRTVGGLEKNVCIRGKLEIIGVIDSSAVSTRQPETGAKISKCSGHFFSPQRSPQNSRPRVPFNDLRCRPCVPSHCKYVLAEKAGVGGSTPSLATIILKNLAKNYVLSSSPLSV